MISGAIFQDQNESLFKTKGQQLLLLILIFIVDRNGSYTCQVLFSILGSSLEHLSWDGWQIFTGERPFCIPRS